MKLLFLTFGLGSGGTERVTANLANYWSSRGWRVVVVTVSGSQRDFYTLHPSVQRTCLGMEGSNPTLLSALHSNLWRLKAIRTTLQHEKPDVAVGMATPMAVLLSIASRGLRGIFTIGSERTYPALVPVGRIWQALRRYSYGYLDAIVVPTEKGAQWIVQHTHARRVVAIPNPVCFPIPSNSPAVCPESVGQAGRKRLLAVGRLAEEKGFSSLVEAFGRLASRHRDWELVILGEGPLRPELEAKRQAMGLTHRVYLPSRVGNIGEWYNRSHLFALSSSFEGFPNALLEALASGVPAVSYDCDTGPRDIIRHGVDGLLVPPKDVDAFVAALDRLMADDVLRARFSIQAQEARTRFSVSRIAAWWERLFAERTASSPCSLHRQRET